MPVRYDLTPEAKQDIRNIWLYTVDWEAASRPLVGLRRVSEDSAKASFPDAF